MDFAMANMLCRFLERGIETLATPLSAFGANRYLTVAERQIALVVDLMTLTVSSGRISVTSEHTRWRVILAIVSILA